MENRTVKIAGDGFISSGNYKKINIMGNATSKGNIYSEIVKINGDGRFDGNLSFGDFKVNGDVRIEGDLKANVVKVNGDLMVSGNCKIEKLVVNGDFKINGTLECNNVTIRGDLKSKDSVYAKDLKTYGDLKVDKNIECEDIKIYGSIYCSGLLTGENILIYPKGRSYCKEIGATNLEITKHMNTGFLNIKINLGSMGTLKSDLIECDFAKLQNTKVDILRGKDILLSKKCEVNTVEYTDNLEVSSDSNVKSSNKVS